LSDEVNDQSGQTGPNSARARNRWAYRNPLLYPNKVLNNFKTIAITVNVTLTAVMTTILSQTIGQGTWLATAQMTVLTNIAPATGVITGSILMDSGLVDGGVASASGGGYCAGTDFWFQMSVVAVFTLKKNSTVTLQASTNVASNAIAKWQGFNLDTNATQMTLVRLI